MEKKLALRSYQGFITMNQIKETTNVKEIHTLAPRKTTVVSPTEKIWFQFFGCKWLIAYWLTSDAPHYPWKVLCQFYENLSKQNTGKTNKEDLASSGLCSRTQVFGLNGNCLAVSLWTRLYSPDFIIIFSPTFYNIVLKLVMTMSNLLLMTLFTNRINRLFFNIQVSFYLEIINAVINIMTYFTAVASLLPSQPMTFWTRPFVNHKE